MIKSLKIKNFRNFDEKELFFSDKRNIIVWENGRWKTNILESISLVSLNSIINVDFEDLVKKDMDVFFIKASLDSWDSVSISYDKQTNKKNYFFNEKRLSKTKLKEKSISSVSFSPIIMNLLYLSPSLRRNFLDTVLGSTFVEYSDYLKKYKTIVQNRNKILKNIRENKSSKSEIIFWNQKVIELSKIIYNYRFWLIEFLQEHIWESKQYFLWKIKNIDLVYKTKVTKDTIEEDIKTYLERNLDRDIMIWTSSIWPHVDDFEILADNTSVVNFASRWEIKSIILELKIAEIKFIEKYLNKKPILVIDDLFSELDENHKDMLLKKLNWYQTFISSINLDIDDDSKTFNLN